MVSTLTSFDTSHEDMIHDAQMDYYGRRLATCSSDRTIRIFEVDGDTTRLVEVLRGHDGPVWQVAWAHPKFGSILASCSYDGKVVLWKETGNVWGVLREFRVHDASVNAISWAPHEFGLSLACASSDSRISILTMRHDGTWNEQSQMAHQTGCNAISWAPALSSSSGAGASVRRLATGGCDNSIIIWRYNDEDSQNQWSQEQTLTGHSDWIRDLAWAQYVGGTGLMLASCSQDKQVYIWTLENETWSEPVALRPEGFTDVVWRVSWSVTGTILAVSSGDNKVTLFKQAVDGSWECLNELDDAAGAATGQGAQQ